MWPAGSDEDGGSVQSRPSRGSDSTRLEISQFTVILSTYIQSPLQLARGGGEAVEDEVLPHGVDPLAPRGQRAADEVPAVSLAGGEGPDDLPLHVHDDHRVGPVTHHDLVHVLRHHVDRVNVNISPRCPAYKYQVMTRF